MGNYIFDQYSLLHFAVGIIAYFWNISLMTTLILHILFEIVENTNYGMHFINTYFKIWPGGKPYPDSFINSMGDNVSTVLGWLSAYYIDKLSGKFGLYQHLKK
jgi:hypothetical protein